MQLALECPISYAHELIPLTDFNFLLTHLVLEDKKYREFYSTRAHIPNIPTFTVLDNSVNELGQPCTLEEMQKAADLIKPDIVIPPDYLLDWKKTVETLYQGINIWGKSKIWPVIQGGTREEVWSCAYELIKTLGFDTICVPFDITLARHHHVDELAKAREGIVMDLLHMDSDIKIHLLGFNTFEEIDRYKFLPNNVVSIDTGSPYTNSRYNRRMNIDPLLPKSFHIDYSDSFDEMIAKYTIINLAHMRKRFNVDLVPTGIKVRI